MKTIRLCVPLLCVPFFVSLASAQSTVDFNVGLGTAYSKSNGAVIDTFGDGVLYRTPKLSGAFLGFGGTLMMNSRLGFGAQINLQPNKPEYAGLQARTTFWDLNATYQPIATDRMSLQLQGGLGGANMRFYYSQNGCNTFTGCFSSSDFLDSSNHFMMRGSAGIQVYLTEHLFIRPQVDLRYVPNFFQFGSNFVPGGTVWIGYSLGDRR